MNIRMRIDSVPNYKARNTIDRRRAKTFPPPKYLFTGRRKAVRRASDTNGKYYTDHRRPRLSALIIFIIILSIFDYHFTLSHLDRDAIELNPLMAMAIEVGESYFFLLKYFITTLGLFILYLYKDFFPTLKVVVSIFMIYSTLTLYHVWGYFSMPG